MVIYDFNPQNLPGDYLKAIGLVIACASHTEEIMREFMGIMLGIDNVEAIALGTHMSTPMKDDIIRTVIELNAPSASELDQLDDILDGIREAMERRNAVAHNSFAIHPESGEIYSLRERARGSLQVEFKSITAAELSDIANSVYASGMMLQKFMTSRNLSPKFREKQLREPLNRKKKARAERREQHGEKY